MNRDSLVVVAATAGAISALILEKVITAFLARNSRKSSVVSKISDTTIDETSLWCPAPHPNWRPPENQRPPYAADTSSVSFKMHSVDTSITAGSVLYPLIISAVVPRPIAFISTLGTDGTGNLAPYSYFNVVAHDPPHVVIGFCASALKSAGRKDSLANILSTKEFVVNIISEWFVEAANHCCGAFDYGINEMELSGLTPVPAIKVAPPRVQESACQMECVLAHSYEVRNSATGTGEVTTTIVIGQVLMVHVADGVAGKSPSGKLVVDIGKYKPVCRLGGNTYGWVGGLFDLPRPDRNA